MYTIAAAVVRGARRAHLVLWWIPAGHEPTVEEAEERLDYLRAHGPTAEAFTFKQRFGPPTAEPHETKQAPRRLGSA